MSREAGARVAFADLLERLALGRASSEEWQALVVAHYQDELLEDVRRKCVRLAMAAEPPGGWSAAQREGVRGLAAELRGHDPRKPPSAVMTPADRPGTAPPLRRLEARSPSPVATAVGTSVVATALIGGVAIIVAYRLFQGPGTNQLLLMWLFATGWCLFFGSPVAIVVGLAAGRIASRLPLQARRRGGVVALWTVACALVYTLAGWAAAYWRLSAAFELHWQFVPIGLVTGLLVGPLVAWTLHQRERDRTCAVQAAP